MLENSTDQLIEIISKKVFFYTAKLAFKLIFFV